MFCKMKTQKHQSNERLSNHSTIYKLTWIFWFIQLIKGPLYKPLKLKTGPTFWTLVLPKQHKCWEIQSQEADFNSESSDLFAFFNVKITENNSFPFFNVKITENNILWNKWYATIHGIYFKPFTCKITSMYFA